MALTGWGWQGLAVEIRDLDRKQQSSPEDPTVLQRFAIYIVNSTPNRKSLARGVSHFIASPVFAAPVVGLTSDSIAKDKVLEVSPARHLRCTDHRTPRVNADGALQRITEYLGG
jgi:hypothetical protein